MDQLFILGHQKLIKTSISLLSFEVAMFTTPYKMDRREYVA